MGDLGDSLAGWGTTIALYREPIAFMFVAIATLTLSVIVSRRAAAWIDALEEGSFSAERRGNNARRIETVERQLKTAEAFRDAKWKQAGRQMVYLLTAGIVIPTLCLILFALNYQWFFAGPAFAQRISDCMCTVPATFQHLTPGQLGSLFVTSLFPEDIAKSLLPMNPFDTAYNLNLVPMLVAFWVHKLWAFVYVLQLIQDFSLKLFWLSASAPARITELENKLKELRAEKNKFATSSAGTAAPAVANDTATAIAA